MSVCDLLKYHNNPESRCDDRTIEGKFVCHFRLSLLFMTVIVSDLGDIGLMRPSAERERYYDPSFCPFAARNKHLLRHHVKCEERWRGAIDVDCRETFLPRGSLAASLSSRLSGRFSLPTVYHPEERNGGTFPNVGKPPSR